MRHPLTCVSIYIMENHCYMEKMSTGGQVLHGSTHVEYKNVDLIDLIAHLKAYDNTWLSKARKSKSKREMGKG